MKINTAVPAHLHFAFVRLFVAGAETGRSDSDLIYIKVWKRTGRHSAWVACYAWGFKEDDAPKPKPLPQAVHERNYRERKRKLAQSPMAVIAGHLT